ncbi:hypothetical protein EYC95_21770 [Pseudomonas sp. BGI-2]|nr:hypothetical protein EYC95_21770 [Pseudomonas sp. BGI-2]
MQNPVGAGLLAKAVCQPAKILNDTPLSRASPLPHGYQGIYVELRRRHVRSNADLFVDGMRGYWASSAPRTQL